MAASGEEVEEILSQLARESRAIMKSVHDLHWFGKVTLSEAWDMGIPEKNRMVQYINEKMRER